ncbi:MAG: 16S rRNA (cytidine(1402)-2'-O)-methyltransferase, partial [Nitrospirales bacterium]|nr:16S rRNA (cytidine(1402)-2'-O)-methyltransferase [Nitrospirales bacterium]
IALLNHYGIAKPMVSYWAEKEKVRSEAIIEKLLSGLSVALISDAGTPGISDPGTVLVRRAIDEGIEVIPIPGPSALVAALSISGLSTEEFAFIGFLPQKAGQRQKKLSDLALEERTLAFYEAPHRLLDTLSDMRETLGDRKVVVVKEITKLHEEVVRGFVSSVLQALETKTIVGEYVILVEGKMRELVSFDEALEEVRSLTRRGIKRKEAVRTVAEGYGLSKKLLYDRSLGLDDSDE